MQATGAEGASKSPHILNKDEKKGKSNETKHGIKQTQTHFFIRRGR